MARNKAFRGRSGMIVIVNYGVGNLQSVERMVRKAGAVCNLTDDPNAIRAADKVILPGVGNFGHCASMFRASPSFEAVNWFALEAKRPILGICVGAQMLGRSSEEAEGAQGLGWLEMECRRFATDLGERIPRMGWGQIEPTRSTPLLPDLDEDSRFYFVHSYFMQCDEPSIVLATTDYGGPYTCAVNKDNIFGVQFHPEKSLRHGLGVMRAFAAL